MKTRYLTLLAALGAVLPPCAAADTPTAVSADCAYALDTVKDWPRALKTAADVAAARAVFKAGDSLMTTAPDGTVTVAAKASNATEALPINEGGLWSFANDRQKGEASFTVRHSIYGTQGAGTEASPAKLVDTDELADLIDAGTAGSGYVFLLRDPKSMLSEMSNPSGFCMERMADGLWRIITSENGCVSTWAEISFSIDSERKGPDRRLGVRDVRPVSYSGDNWMGDMSKAAQLTFIPPAGENIVLDLAGTGATEFTFDRPGTWTIRLTMADDTVREATIRVRKTFIMSFR